MSQNLSNFGSKILMAGLLSFATFSPALAEGDAAAGEKVFKRCAACHKVGPGAKNSVGPQLNGVIGRAAGGVDGYKYGKGIQAAAGKGLVWDEENLLPYLADPKGYIREYTGDAKAKVKMVLKLKKEDDRKNVIAYLKTIPAE